MESEKPIIFSGIQPSGTFTLGNYLGAVKNWGPLQAQNNCIYCVVDLHSLTVHIDAEKRRSQTREAFAMLLACGLDAEQSTIFVQSHVPAHAELAWVLGCYAQYGELTRMTQFKDKGKRHPDNVNSGLFSYPVLMAADIIAYNANFVPVGEDQRQHVELARNIANRFNVYYPGTLTVPEGSYAKLGAKIMSLQDPAKKMSKTDENENSYILLSDADDVIMKKFKRSVTDSDNVIAYSKAKPGISNLLTIYCAVKGCTTKQAVKDFEGAGYGALKTGVAEAVIETLRPIKQTYNALMADKAQLDRLLARGAEKAAAVADKTVKKVYNAVGLLAK